MGIRKESGVSTLFALLVVVAVFIAFCFAVSIAGAGIYYAYYSYTEDGKAYMVEYDLCLNRLSENIELTPAMSKEISVFCTELAPLSIKIKEGKKRRHRTNLLMCGEGDVTYFNEGIPVKEAKKRVIYDYVTMEKYDCKTASYSNL